MGGDPRIGEKQTKAKMTHLSCFSAPTERRVDEDSVGPRSQEEPKRLGLGRENCHGDNPQALELSIGSFSQFFGNCHKIGSTTKEANEA